MSMSTCPWSTKRTITAFNPCSIRSQPPRFLADQVGVVQAAECHRDYGRGERHRPQSSRRRNARWPHVELAGAIADVAHNVLARDFRRVDPRSAKIVLLDAGKRVLPTFEEELSEYTREALRKMGVEVLAGCSVTDVSADGVTLSDGRRIDCCCTLWAAGVRASAAAAWLEAPADRAGRVIVDDSLRVSPHRNIFAIGDVAASTSEGKPVPGLAPAAKQMGQFVGSLIAQELSGESRKPEPFVYRHQGDLATIGRKSAVVSLRRIRLKGSPGWLFWSVVHIYFLIGLRNRITVAINWLWEYLTFQRGARLIS